jgi:hypothetical protein
MTTIPLDTVQDPELAPRLVILCVALAIFDLVMKWISAYKAWTRKQVWRFVCLFIFNTCGILPIIYLIINRKKD